MFTVTPAHAAIFEHVARGSGHACIRARAGSGKSSTLEQAVRHVPAGKSIVFFAFNKDIVKALEARFICKACDGVGRRDRLEKACPACRGSGKSANVQVFTVHSFGLKVLTRAVGRVPLAGKEGEPEKVPTQIRALFIQEQITVDGSTAGMRRSLGRLVSLAKGALVTERADLDALIDRHDLAPLGPERSPFQSNGALRSEEDVETEAADDRSLFLRLAGALMAAAGEFPESIDYDDMIYLPALRGLVGAQYDQVFIDELQDLNPAQLRVIRAACKPGGRICAVGDDKQSVYAFRGADSESMPNFIRTFDATVFPLSTTYRCARAIVAEVQHLVPDFEAGPDNPEGLVEEVAYEAIERGVRPGDFILSRTNAPLVALCMQLLRSGRPARVAGRDVGSKLLGMVDRSQAKTVAALETWVAAWRTGECARLRKEERDVTAVEDTAACLAVVCEGARTMAEVRQKLDALFSDRAAAEGAIELSSTHKAKGLERDRVWLLQWTYLKMEREGKALSAAQRTEEENLYYVAVTRAKCELYVVEEPARGARGERRSA
jgi:DNA helicase-2/ATP-dependent DNA helicase PcrA